MPAPLFPYPLPTWLDGDYTVASPISLPVFSSPIAATTEEYVLTQNFTQLMVCRALLGLGFGGEWAAGAILIGEAVRPQYRGRVLRRRQLRRNRHRD